MSAYGGQFLLQNIGEFSSALEWIAKFKLDIPGILHLLDDFLLVSETSADCMPKVMKWKFESLRFLCATTLLNAFRMQIMRNAFVIG